MLARRITTPPFRWNVPVDTATTVLAAAYRAEVYARRRQFIDDEAASVNVRKVAEALASLGHPKFGILVCGGCGNGKSTMMAAVRTGSAYLDREGCFNYTTSRGVVHPMDIRFRTVDATDLCLPSSIESLQTIAGCPLLIIEDVGQEPLEVQLYGNIFYPVMMVIERRYSLCLPTFATTNLSPEQVGSRYGRRMRDRLREMMFTVAFDNPSYRK